MARDKGVPFGVFPRARRPPTEPPGNLRQLAIPGTDKAN